MTAQQLREKIVNSLAEFYLIHCKPEQRPQFQKLEEAEAWNKEHIYQIEQIVGQEADIQLALFREAVTEIIGEDTDMDDLYKKRRNRTAIDWIATEKAVKSCNQLRTEQRTRLSHILEER